MFTEAHDCNYFLWKLDLTNLTLLTGMGVKINWWPYLGSCRLWYPLYKQIKILFGPFMQGILSLCFL